MRELQRMEMPDRLTDIQDAPVILPAVPALTMAYRRRFATTSAAIPNAYDQAECLYVILAEMRDGERSALDFFLTSEIGDVDQDGANEILDPWGTPVQFYFSHNEVMLRSAGANKVWEDSAITTADDLYRTAPIDHTR
jgi:hypothetical protein